MTAGASSTDEALRQRLASIRARIDDASRRVGRTPEDVVLVGASKRQDEARLRSAFDAGLVVFGENRVQEAITKSARLPIAIDWHLIGPLQSNKAKAAARLFSTIHSLDRAKIVHTLDREAGRLGRRLYGFLQVDLGDEATKHGFAVDGLVETVEPFARLEHLDVVGLMAIPPYEESLDEARQWFGRLRSLRDELALRPAWRDRPGGWPGALSMGMSHDFEVAIEEGATHVRVGSALFGPRLS